MLDVTIISAVVGVLLMLGQQVLKNRAILTQYHRTISLGLCFVVAVALTYGNGGFTSFDLTTLYTTVAACFGAAQAAYAILPSNTLDALLAPKASPRG